MINSWRHDRDSEGWKMHWRTYRTYLALSKVSTLDSGDEHYDLNAEAPFTVQGTKLLREYLKVLEEMFSSDEPVLRLVRG